MSLLDIGKLPLVITGARTVYFGEDGRPVEQHRIRTPEIPAKRLVEAVQEDVVPVVESVKLRLIPE